MATGDNSSSSSFDSEYDSFFSNAGRKIILPVDASINSVRSFDTYIENLFRKGDSLLLMHVVEPENSGHSNGHTSRPTFPIDEINEQISHLVTEGRKIGKKYIHRCHELDVNARFIMQIGAKPGERICNLARQHNVDCIVIGSRGLNTIRRTFMGSVSDYVLHHSNVTIIIVPPPRK